jgi:hypothetical protein
MISEYKFAPPGTKPAALPSSLNSIAPAQPPTDKPSGRDVVAMEPYEVRETGAGTSAFLPLSPSKPDSPRTSAAAKLGIGLHRFHVGKLHCFVNTIFYVPILVGFEW